MLEGYAKWGAPGDTGPSYLTVGQVLGANVTLTRTLARNLTLVLTLATLVPTLTPNA